MNTIYSSSDKILSFLACTCVNYLTQASVAACQAVFWHTTAIYCHCEEWQPPSKLVSQACLFFLITKQVFVLKSLWLFKGERSSFFQLLSLQIT